MATIVERRRRYERDHIFFLSMAIALAVTVVGGFATQALAGRVDIPHVPFWVHLHGLVFLSWMVLYVTQNALILRGSIALHRQLGWLAAGLACVMLPLAATTASMAVRLGRTPPFFRPDFFLSLSILELAGFAGLTAAAIALRKRTEWHRRLMLSGTIVLSGPAWGRLLPMPLLGGWGEYAVLAVLLLYLAVGMIYDLRTRGRVHPAYLWGAGTIAATILLLQPLANTPPIAALAAALTS